MLLDDTGVDIGETDIRILKLSKVVLMDCLLELVSEALGDHLEGVMMSFDSLWQIRSLLCHWVDALVGMLLGYLLGLVGSWNGSLKCWTKSASSIMMPKYLAWPVLKGNKMAARFWSISVRMTTISGYVGSLRQHMSLGKGIAARTVSAMMWFNLAMLSIGGACEGDDFN